MAVVNAESRAVLKEIKAGSSAICPKCDEQVKFQAKVKAQVAICNVYIDGKWDHVEHFHEKCYNDAGQPYGKPTQGPKGRRTK